MPKTRFIRVKDVGTKHEFDVPATDWRIAKGLLVPVKSDRYPPVDRPRQAKPHIELAPLPAPAPEPAEPTPEDLGEVIAEPTPEPTRPPSRSRKVEESGND